MALQFSKSGDAAIEKSYRTHYVSAALGEQKRQKLQEKLERAPQPVVFQILRDSECSECGAEIAQGAFLSKEAEEALCLSRAHLDDLEFLPCAKIKTSQGFSRSLCAGLLSSLFAKSPWRWTF